MHPLPLSVVHCINEWVITQKSRQATACLFFCVGNWLRRISPREMAKPSANSAEIQQGVCTALWKARVKCSNPFTRTISQPYD
jgi:hypothetical protein